MRTGKIQLINFETLNLKNLLLAPVFFFDWTYLLRKGAIIGKTGKSCQDLMDIEAKPLPLKI